MNRASMVPGTAEFFAQRGAQLLASGSGGMIGGGLQAEDAARRTVQAEAKAAAKRIQKEQKEIRKISSVPYVTGMVVAVVIGGALLMFVYYDVLNKNKLIFGMLVAVLGIFLFISLGRSVREQGAGAMGQVELVGIP
jgi:hypothetical protein